MCVNPTELSSEKRKKIHGSIRTIANIEGTSWRRALRSHDLEGGKETNEEPQLRRPLKAVENNIVQRLRNIVRIN